MAAFRGERKGQTTSVRNLPLLVLVAGLLTACGAKGKLYTASKTRACLAEHGATIGAISSDFVASTATGGAFRAYLPGNFVTLGFGSTVHDANQITDAYRRFAGKQVGLKDVLFKQGNAVMLWHLQPQGLAAGVTNCLK